MSEDKEMGPEELATQDAELLPERAAMSVIRGMPVDHALPPILPIEDSSTGDPGDPAPPPMAE